MAGVFGSPQLLLISGIGPAKTLQHYGIDVIADRPGVGQNMQDHIYFGPSYRENAPTSSSFSNPAFAAQAAKDFNEKAAGLYTNPTIDVLAWEGEIGLIIVHRTWQERGWSAKTVREENK